MKGKFKGLKITAVIIFTSAIVVAIAFGLLVSIVYRNINFEGDERLFESARCFNSTTFYANGADRGSDKYEPIAIEISGNMRKIFYSTDEVGKYLRDGFIDS